MARGERADELLSTKNSDDFISLGHAIVLECRLRDSEARSVLNSDGGTRVDVTIAGRLRISDFKFRSRLHADHNEGTRFGQRDAFRLSRKEPPARPRRSASETSFPLRSSACVITMQSAIFAGIVAVIGRSCSISPLRCVCYYHYLLMHYGNSARHEGREERPARRQCGES